MLNPVCSVFNHVDWSASDARAEAEDGKGADLGL